MAQRQCSFPNGVVPQTESSSVSYHGLVDQADVTVIPRFNRRPGEKVSVDGLLFVGLPSRVAFCKSFLQRYRFTICHRRLFHRV